MGLPVWIAACPICKRLSRGRALCGPCAANLWFRREPVVRRYKGFRIRSLFSWRKDGWLGLRWWVHALKHKEEPLFWRESAVWALDTFPRPPGVPVLIPVPSRGKNHALGFAREISRWSGWEVAEPLVLETEPAQKGLNRSERQLRYFRLKDDPCSKFTNVIIVDDVVTTGATAKAAFIALGKPNRCEVWCLMDRRPCDGEAALL